MDIIMSLHKKWSDMILDGTKPLEFRTKLPKNFEIGDKIYIYETAKQGGSRKIVGSAVVKQIISVLNEDGRWPMYGAYPFIDYFYETIKNDRSVAEHYRKLKSEFGTYSEYKCGFFLGYAFSEHELNSLRKDRTLIDTWKLFDIDLISKILSDNNLSDKYIEECDNWLTKIGFYNDCGESFYKYGIVLSNVERFQTPIELSDMLDRNQKSIMNVPQSWMYTMGRRGQ